MSKKKGIERERTREKETESGCAIVITGMTKTQVVDKKWRKM